MTVWNLLKLALIGSEGLITVALWFYLGAQAIWTESTLLFTPDEHSIVPTLGELNLPVMALRLVCLFAAISMTMPKWQHIREEARIKHGSYWAWEGLSVKIFFILFAYLLRQRFLAIGIDIFPLNLFAAALAIHVLYAYWQNRSPFWSSQESNYHSLA